MLPPDGTRNDPDADAARRKVASMWRQSCETWSGALATAMRQLGSYNDAEMGGPFRGHVRKFEGVGDFFGGDLSAR